MSFTSAYIAKPQKGPSWRSGGGCGQRFPDSHQDLPKNEVGTES